MAETHKLVMDPSETLQEIRELLIAHRKSNGYKGTLEEVAERVEALDDWLSKGGYPPDEWAPPTASPKTRRGDRKRPTYESYAHNTARSGDGTVPVILENIEDGQCYPDELGRNWHVATNEYARYVAYWSAQRD
jgi:hypothetical protein